MRTPYIIIATIGFACAACGSASVSRSNSDIPTNATHASAPAVSRTPDVHEAEDHEVILATGCGVERWPVKTGTDADRAKVKVSTLVETTISYLRSRPKPAHYPTSNRIAPVELTRYHETATLTQYKIEADGDIHLVVKDSAGRSMIAEIPNPSCVGSSSPFRTRIATARTNFQNQLHATTSWKHVSRTVRLDGVGFFDVLHGQTGVAPNGIELHPILGIAIP